MLKLSLKATRRALVDRQYTDEPRNPANGIGSQDQSTSHLFVNFEKLEGVLYDP